MKKIYLTAAVAAMMIVNTVAHADNEIQATVDSDTYLVTVSGEMGAELAERRVMVTVLAKGDTNTDPKALTSDNLSDNVAGIYMAYTNDSGEYAVSFRLKADAGEYTAIVSGPEKDVHHSTVFFNPGDVSSILGQIERARQNKDSSRIKDILSDEANFRSLGIGKHEDKIYGVSFADLDAFCLKLLAEYNKPYDSAASFLDRYRVICVTKSFNSIMNEADVLPLIDECDAVLGIKSTNAFEIYDGLKNKSAVNSVMVKGGFSSSDEIKQRFCDNVYLSAIASMQNWSEFSAFIKQNNDYLGLDLTEYDKLKTPSAADKAMVGRSFGSISELKTAFNSAVRNASASESNQSSSGGGGGGGGGGSAAVTSSAHYSASTSVSYTPPAVTITPQPVSENTEEPVITQFNDIDHVPWAKEAIESLAAKAILDGKSEGEFYPDDTLAREECAKILVEAFNITKDDLSCSFTDIDSDHWSYIYVAAAQKADIINGYDDGSFGLGHGVTRQELATMIYRTAVANGFSFNNQNTTEFTDSYLISDYAEDAVQALSGAGIINGRDDGSFAPNDKCTRAEAAKMIYEVLRINGEEREDA